MQNVVVIDAPIEKNHTSRLSSVFDRLDSSPVLGRILSTRQRSIRKSQAPPRTRVSGIFELLQGTFRSIGQVAFCNSAVTGALIYIGCSIDRPLAALLGFLSALLCTLLGYVAPNQRDAALNGLHGYNAFLVGMGMGYFDTNLTLDSIDWAQFGLLIPPMIFTTLWCFLVHLALSNSLSTPAFTFAYNIALPCWLSLAVNVGPSSGYYPSFVSSEIAAPSSDLIEYSSISFGWFVRSVLAGVGQVYFSPELTPSIIIATGLAVCSPIAASLGLFGSAIGVTVAIITHSNAAATEIGLDGLSAVLGAIAIGGFYFAPTLKSTIGFAGITSVVCVGMRYVLQGLLVRPNGPAMTLPFCITATIVVLGLRALKIMEVPKHLLDSPERHMLLRRSPESPSIP